MMNLVMSNLVFLLLCLPIKPSKVHISIFFWFHEHSSIKTNCNKSDSKLAYESLTETSVDKPELKQKFLTQDVAYLRRDGMMSATLRNRD